MLSVASAGVLVLPWAGESQVFTLVALGGAAIGSLVPDVDANDAAIFHEDLRGLNDGFGEAINNLIGPLLPVFGYVNKYLVYKPVVLLYDRVVLPEYDFEEKHRTFTHSFLGVLSMTAIIGVYMVPVLVLLELLAPIFLGVFMAFYAFGMFLHMLEDSCTKTGIAWNSPFSDTKLRGQISTGKDVARPRWFLYVLGFLCFVSFYLPSSQEYSIGPALASGVGAGLLAICWLVFTKLGCKMELRNR